MLLLVFFVFYSVSSRSIPDINDVEEIQHAVCKVATEEVQAQANATITRQLKGVCSMKAMNQRMDEMQRSLFLEMQILKLMLQSGGFTTPKPSLSQKSIENHEDYDYTYEDEDLGNSSKTIQTDLGQAFVYDWKIPNVSSTFEKDLYFTSLPIEFLNMKIFIKCSTKHNGSSFVSFQLLEPTLFKNKYRFVLLGKKGSGDMNSPLFEPRAGRVFRISKEKLLGFTVEDCLMVKLLVYMN